MAKIILAKNNAVLQEITLSKQRIAIGRSPHNDVVIDDRAISAEHAVIVTMNDDSFLEDLNSTNGTQVNGQPIKKHFLQENDVIELAQYRIQYFPDDRKENALHLKNASIKILDGPHAGKETSITKALTTIGRPEIQVAVIARRPEAYYLTHIEGESVPIVNGHNIGTLAQALADGDVITLSGVRIQFILK